MLYTVRWTHGRNPAKSSHFQVMRKMHKLDKIGPGRNFHLKFLIRCMHLQELCSVHMCIFLPSLLVKNNKQYNYKIGFVARMILYAVFDRRFEKLGCAEA